MCAVLLLVLSALPASSEASAAPASGVVLSLSRLSGSSSAAVLTAARDLREAHQEPDEPVAYAAAVGLALLEEQHTFAELQECLPVALVLADARRMVVLIGGDDEWCQLVEPPGLFVTVEPRKELEALFTGRCYRLSRSASADGPRIEIEHPHQVLGSGYVGASLPGSATIRNVGQAPLSVGLISASCACTTSLALDLLIEPGDAAEVPVTLRLGGPGQVLEYIWLSTNDPTRPRVAVSVAATGKEGVVAFPSEVRIASPLEGGAEAGIRLVAPAGTKVTALACEPGECTARIASETTADGHVEYILVLRSSAGTAGTARCALVVATDHPDFATVRVQIVLARR